MLSSRDIRTKTDPDTSDTSYEIFYDTLINISINPLIETKWTQYSSYNRVVPTYYDPQYGTMRCVVGCVPVALAQFLYYTHNNYYVPTAMYENGTCTNSYNQGPPYNGFSFSNWSSNAWSIMPKTIGESITNPQLSIDAVAALIGYLTKDLGTRYTFDGSKSFGTTTIDSIPHVLQNNGIYNSQIITYSNNNVLNDLLNGRPVIASGLENSAGQYGHAYLIDGYQRLRVQILEIITYLNGQTEEYLSYSDNPIIHVNTGDPINIGGVYSSTYWTSPSSYFPFERKTITYWSTTP